MDFALERLGAERFQKLCQALLLSTFPNLQCLPVNQADGGRDAFSRKDAGFTVFQVKFTENYQAKSERDSIRSLIKSEAKKVKVLIQQGATAYYFMTNVQGTSRSNVGSIDTINDILSKEFGIPCFVWWRDDIERRIESHEGIIWRYPELARGQDFLEFLVKGGQISTRREKADALSAYMATQYSRESEVRFQQVQIQNKLLDLFTDTPLGLSREKIPSQDSLCLNDFQFQELQIAYTRSLHLSAELESSEILAASWLINAEPESGVQRIVLEGAPGQGKSTVTQYLCQINRAIGLGRLNEIRSIPISHQEKSMRIPLKVDLRDYALWLTGKDPSVGGVDEARPSNSDDALESYLSYQIHRLSGGREFVVDDLMGVLRGAHVLVVLDGFDEVADTTLRSKLIEQIRFAAERLGTSLKSLQIIVTSRPAAFILSSGFPEKEWLHVGLKPMQKDQIVSYTDKWITAKNFDEESGREFKNLLIDRISREHIRSLAQNPMQLAILLNLISTKGRSLPDKRTALYDSYMDLFFGREAEKDEVVRENRDVLLQIHQFVAWSLQSGAEIPGGRGSISQDDLQKLVQKFLLDKEHTGDVLKLFTGVVERVGALVSRVQGTLEFEVQPLREYFTGRFLYETSPYSPPGAERGGTKPDIFRALAQRPYWSNVARFYAGCYSSGELASLVSGLEELIEGRRDDQPEVASHAIQLAILFLNDWVFSQEPKSVRDVVRMITSSGNIYLLLASKSSWDERRVYLPEKCGRDELVCQAAKLFLAVNEIEFVTRLGRLIRANSDIDYRWNLLSSISNDNPQKYNQAIALGIFFDCEIEKIDSLLNQFDEIVYDALIAAGRWNVFDQNQRMLAVDNLANGKYSPRYFTPQIGRGSFDDVGLFRLYVMLNPQSYIMLSYGAGHGLSIGELFQRYGLNIGGDVELEDAALDRSGFGDILRASERGARISIDDWNSTLSPWTDLIESARRRWGTTILLQNMAAIAAGIRSKLEKAFGFSALLDESLPLAERARFARLKTSVSWWSKQLSSANSETSKVWVLSLLFSWAPKRTFKELEIEITKAVDSLTMSAWGNLIASVRMVVSVTANNRTSNSIFSRDDFDKNLSWRVKTILTVRMSRVQSKKICLDMMQIYNGKDPFIINYLWNGCIERAFSDGDGWENIAGFYTKNRTFLKNMKPDPFATFDNYYYYHRNNMAQDMARKIMSKPDSYPFSMVEVAGYRMTMPIEKAAPLLQVAQSDGWFAS